MSATRMPCYIIYLAVNSVERWNIMEYVFKYNCDNAFYINKNFVR